MQNYEYGNNPDLKAHAAITRQSAAEGVVLLKNEATLPISTDLNVALLGVTSYDFIAGGTGSGDVNEAYTISLEQGLLAAGFSINETAKAAFDAYRAANEEAFVKPEGPAALFTPYSPPEMELSAEEIQQIAQAADVGILTIGRNAGEGGDRIIENDFLLSSIEQEMIQRTCVAFQALGKKVIVVLNIGGVIETSSWNARPDAIVLAWQGGQEGGNSVADVLAGKISPSGKLPMTFPLKLDDHAANANFPLLDKQVSLGESLLTALLGDKNKPVEEQVKNIDFTKYEEGIYVGYRHFDKKQIPVAYPFGYGLSYTNFEYSAMNTTLENDTIKISLNVTNTGTQAGKEVVQIYATKPNTSIDRPTQELKAFAKTVELLPDSTEQIRLQIPKQELSYWDENNARWALERGVYQLKAAASSRDVLLVGEVEL